MASKMLICVLRRHIFYKIKKTAKGIKEIVCEMIHISGY